MPCLAAGSFEPRLGRPIRNASVRGPFETPAAYDLVLFAVQLGELTAADGPVRIERIGEDDTLRLCGHTEHCARVLGAL